VSPPLPPGPGDRSFPDQEYLDPARYGEKWQEWFGHRSEGYFAMHRRRYYELFNALACFYREMKQDARVLELGVSEFLLFYKLFFPGIRLVTADRPLAQHGFAASFCLEKGGAERHYEIDLNREELTPAFGSPPLGRFDYVVCTEVLEHLIVNPVEFLKSLLSLLSPGGRLYLTTPNFFRHENLEKISRGVNPLMIYPPRGGNMDAHHHFREFAMAELLAFAVEAGGKAIFHCHSGCWDPEEPGAPGFIAQPERRSNLVLVIETGRR
jgi:SAM-dependent methyltransferase